MTATGHFRILSEADLKNAVDAPPGDSPKRSAEVKAAPMTETTIRRAEELSLVSTQILRKVVAPDGKIKVEAAKAKAASKKDKFGGFNPYDNN